ncbi:TPA: MFS transporter [Campylobacter jejuni]|uniref:MFS transporter n=1 Tax=Campylobacter jejuni TaxID=197 RepID=UPI002932B6E5|nr:MFS transporter [Campylobacter jejuni]HEC2280609.1 MFS transporter [Campylobacter jejuni]HED0727765.1 MFS transporter [Campylobacter jejuni]HED0799459.1 MFS transporter [Campylobacter jejuni]HED1071294.1 MFS transporter [Campylobacter jejuni]
MKNLNKASSTQIILVFCLGVFGILSTELGMMGIIPIVSQNFSVSISDAGWCASIFALVITFCAPIVPLLCANFNPKKLMLICLAVFILSSLTSAFVGEFWQLLILRYSLLWIRVLCVICINAGIWGFYSYFSDFLHSVGKMNFTLISIVLAIYGFSNIIGNYIAGKTLVKNANFTLILTPLIMIGFYILLFSFYSEIILIIFAFILGILAGVMNNGTHFMISYPFPKAANFSNGLFISVANIGLSTGTAICGLVISLSDTRYIIVNTIVLLILGIIMIFVRSRIEKMKLRF